MRTSTLMATLLLATLSSAHAEIVDIRWSSGGAFTHQAKIAAGKFVEVCGKLPAGLKLRWEFETSAPTDFNVHYHVGEKVVYPFKMSAVASARETLETTLEQDYCWMWTNKGTGAASLSVRLARP